LIAKIKFNSFIFNYLQKLKIVFQKYSLTPIKIPKLTVITKKEGRKSTLFLLTLLTIIIHLALMNYGCKVNLIFKVQQSQHIGIIEKHNNY